MPASHDNGHEAVIDAQFGPQAQAYVRSAVHASGEDLDQLEAIVRQVRPAHALDLGCGGGHVAYRLAPHATQVTACDLSPEMLAAVRDTAAARGFGNIATELAAAERLPFADGAFDFVATRFSAHHWGDLQRGLAEARRVARPGSVAIFIDAVAAAEALFDTHLQAIELLRDRSHVRDYSIAEWTAAAARAGFEVETVTRRRIRIDFADWIARMRTPAPLAAAVLAIQASSPAEVRSYFGVEDDGSFQLDVMTLSARA